MSEIKTYADGIHLAADGNLYSKEGMMLMQLERTIEDDIEVNPVWEDELRGINDAK